jgi:hypothetical protein
MVGQTLYLACVFTGGWPIVRRAAGARVGAHVTMSPAPVTMSPAPVTMHVHTF